MKFTETHVAQIKQKHHALKRDSQKFRGPQPRANPMTIGILGCRRGASSSWWLWPTLRGPSCQAPCRPWPLQNLHAVTQTGGNICNELEEAYERKHAIMIVPSIVGMYRMKATLNENKFEQQEHETMFAQAMSQKRMMSHEWESQKSAPLNL